MREKELRENTDCNLCKQKIGKSGISMFWIVKIERHGIKMDAVNRQQGLTMMLGGEAMLAQVMGADEEMTMPMIDPVKLTICETCAMGRSLPVAILCDHGGPRMRI